VSRDFDTWWNSAPDYERFAGLDGESEEDRAARERAEEWRIGEAMEDGRAERARTD
jgi:hypothetical protein